MLGHQNLLEIEAYDKMGNATRCRFMDDIPVDLLNLTKTVILIVSMYTMSI